MRTFSKVQHVEYSKLIDGVTADQISKAVARALTSTPTLVAQGGQANSLPSFDKVRSLLA